MKTNKVNLKIKEIKEYTGLDLTLCDYFTGLKPLNGLLYFNIILGRPVSESAVYSKLLQLSLDSKIIERAEPNGYNRVAIFIK